MSERFNPLEMPIVGLKNASCENTSRFEASRYLDSPETISEYLAEAMKANDPAVLMKSLSEVAKARGVNQLATDAGVNRESLYKTLKGGDKTRFDTVQRLLLALGVELTVRPIETPQGSSKPATSRAPSEGDRIPTGAPACPPVKPAAKPLRTSVSSRPRTPDGEIADKSAKGVAKKPTPKKAGNQANA